MEKHAVFALALTFILTESNTLMVLLLLILLQHIIYIVSPMGFHNTFLVDFTSIKADTSVLI